MQTKPRKRTTTVWPWQLTGGIKSMNIPWIICLRMCLWKWWNTVCRKEKWPA